MPYIGGKSQAGVYQRIINLIPPHTTYIEPFVGGGAILRLKRPAGRNIAIDLDRRALDALPPGVERHCVNGIGFLASFKCRGGEFVYCDPPYLLSTRGGRRYYRHEMTDADHRYLLEVLQRLPCPVLLSGYPSEMYSEALRGWNCDTFDVMTRGHSWRTECLWFNYPRPAELHDYANVGADRRERWNIERRRRRWTARLERMAPLDRAALFSALVDVMGRLELEAPESASAAPSKAAGPVSSLCATKCARDSARTV